jgi:hypothetical protein
MSCGNFKNQRQQNTKKKSGVIFRSLGFNIAMTIITDRFYFDGFYQYFMPKAYYQLEIMCLANICLKTTTHVRFVQIKPKKAYPNANASFRNFRL